MWRIHIPYAIMPKIAIHHNYSPRIFNNRVIFGFDTNQRASAARDARADNSIYPVVTRICSLKEVSFYALFDNLRICKNPSSVEDERRACGLWKGSRSRKSWCSDVMMLWCTIFIFFGTRMGTASSKSAMCGASRAWLPRRASLYNWLIDTWHNSNQL